MAPQGQAEEAYYAPQVRTDYKPSLKAPTVWPLGSLAPWLTQASHTASFQFFKGPFLLLEVTSDLPWFPGAAPAGNCAVCSCYRDIMGHSPGEEEKL